MADTFYVDDRDGRVILRRKVNAGDSYTMLIRASDGGSPPQNGTVYVTVNVISSQGELSLGKHNLYITLKLHTFLPPAMYINVIWASWVSVIRIDIVFEFHLPTWHLDLPGWWSIYDLFWTPTFFGF